MWLGPDGAIAGAARGAVLVECSTLTVAWVQELAQAAAAAGAECIDAPVTGSKNQAAAGELNFLTGGNAAALETIRPALNAMGRSVTHLGPTGSGALLKLINNFLAGVHVAATAEAVAWIERTELDRAQAIAFLSDSAVGSPVTKTVAARMCAPDFTPNFFLRLMAKDLGYASGGMDNRYDLMLTSDPLHDGSNMEFYAGRFSSKDGTYEALIEVSPD
jgi:3-hydroxyisobutyrate dehydrogenase